MEESAAKSSRRPPPQAIQATAQMVLDSGAAARGEKNTVDAVTGRPRPLPSPLASLDPTARRIVEIDRWRRGEKPNDDE
jgi:hypothetical protein